MPVQHVPGDHGLLETFDAERQLSHGALDPEGALRGRQIDAHRWKPQAKALQAHCSSLETQGFVREVRKAEQTQKIHLEPQRYFHSAHHMSDRP